MTRITGYELYQCLDCGQKHILPVYGSYNFSFGAKYRSPLDVSEVWVCQSCSAKNTIEKFIPLGRLWSPKKDDTPKWFKPIRRALDKNYTEPDLDPWQLYPTMDTSSFNPDT